jgi:dTDP-4-dehydrorhamnose 3,5-epimerase
MKGSILAGGTGSRLDVIPGELDGLLIFQPKVHADPRGFFVETWNEPRYRAAGLDVDFIQDNLSLSRRGTLRGLHFQNPNPQGKLISVWQGEVFDVAVDVRRRSPTFGRWHGLRLSSEHPRQFYVPPGFAHGFYILSETALVHYKCTALYSPQDELTVRWDDPDLGIAWPLGDRVLSEKDSRAPRLGELPGERLFGGH